MNFFNSVSGPRVKCLAMEVNAEQTLAQLRRMVYADNVTDGPTLKDTILKKLAEPESGGYTSVGGEILSTAIESHRALNYL